MADPTPPAPPFDPDALPVPDLGLACMRCGYPLAGLTEHRCPECGERFSLEQYVPPDPMPLLIAGGKPAAATPDVADLLGRYHIPFFEHLDNTRQLFGGHSPLLWRQPPPLRVPRDRYLEAIDLIRRLRQGEPLPPPPPQVADPRDWPCPACGELNPPSFDLCWNCHTPRPPTDPADGAAGSG